jgi:TniQ
MISEIAAFLLQATVLALPPDVSGSTRPSSRRRPTAGRASAGQLLRLSCGVAELGGTCWPLHPRPYRFETLEGWTRRIAAAYRITYPTFCRYGLGMELSELGRLNEDPRPEVLARLAAGTGLPTWRLRTMTTACLWRRLHHALERAVARGWIVPYRSWRVPGQRTFVDGIRGRIR